MKWLRLPTVMAVMTLSCAIGPAIRPQSAAAVSADGMFLEGEVGDYIVGPMHLPLTVSSADAGYRRLHRCRGHRGGPNTATHPRSPPPRPTPRLGGRHLRGEFPLQAAGHPGLSLYGDGKDCSSSTGRFMVDDISFDGGGHLSTFAARWEHHCEDAEAASFGAMSINSAVPYRRRTSARSLSFPGTLVGVPTASRTTASTTLVPRHSMSARWFLPELTPLHSRSRPTVARMSPSFPQRMPRRRAVHPAGHGNACCEVDRVRRCFPEHRRRHRGGPPADRGAGSYVDVRVHRRGGLQRRQHASHHIEQLHCPFRSCRRTCERDIVGNSVHRVDHRSHRRDAHHRHVRGSTPIRVCRGAGTRCVCRLREQTSVQNVVDDLGSRTV